MVCQYDASARNAVNVITATVASVRSDVVSSDLKTSGIAV